MPAHQKGPGLSTRRLPLRMLQLILQKQTTFRLCSGCDGNSFRRNNLATACTNCKMTVALGMIPPKLRQQQIITVTQIQPTPVQCRHGLKASEGLITVSQTHIHRNTHTHTSRFTRIYAATHTLLPIHACMAKELRLTAIGINTRSRSRSRSITQSCAVQYRLCRLRRSLYTVD